MCQTHAGLATVSEANRMKLAVEPFRPLRPAFSQWTQGFCKQLARAFGILAEEPPDSDLQLDGLAGDGEVG
jgi:hypothetical protein